MTTEPLAKIPTREHLLAAGRQILMERGMANLTVRNVAQAAGANLGSFVYHFGTRDAFLTALIEEWYAPLFERVATAAEGGAEAMERLRRSIMQLLDFALANRLFLGRVLMGAAAGEKAARQFLGSLAGRHPRLLLRLIEAAQQDGALVAEHPMQVLCFLASTVGLPLLLASAWEGPPLFGKNVSATLGRMARDRGRILQRLDWALRGLRAGE